MIDHVSRNTIVASKKGITRSKQAREYIHIKMFMMIVKLEKRVGFWKIFKGSREPILDHRRGT